MPDLTMNDGIIVCFEVYWGPLEILSMDSWEADRRVTNDLFVSLHGYLDDPILPCSVSHFVPSAKGNSVDSIFSFHGHSEHSLAFDKDIYRINFKFKYEEIDLLNLE